jgi:ProP effector
VSKAKQQERGEVIALLAERFPKCFSLGAPRKPLKVGIHADILAALGEAIAAEKLRRGLAAYTGTATYLRGIVAGAIRRDLHGQAAGRVTEKEAAAAKAAMARKRPLASAIPTQTPLAPEIAQAESERRIPSDSPSAPGPKRLSLADLRAAARQRRGAV